MNDFFAKNRIVLSRLAAATILFFIFTSNSYWEMNSPIFASVLFFIGVILVTIAAVGRMWCTLYIAGRKNSTLTVDGPYSLCRNPLYLFSFIGVIGIGFLTESIIFIIALIVFFAFYYPFVIKHEQANLTGFFGDTYLEYMKTTPAFFPKFSNYSEPKEYTVNPMIFRTDAYSVVWFIIVIGILEMVEAFRASGVFNALFTFY